MKILYDLFATQPHGKSLFHGAAEYAKTVFNKLCESINNKDIFLEAYYNPDRDIEESVLESCKNYGIKIHKCKSHSEINALLSNNAYDVFYSALPYSYFDLKFPSHTKFIYTIHGIRTLETSADKYFTKYDNIKFRKRIRLGLSLIPAFKKYYDKKVIKRFNKLFSVTENQTIITVSNHSKYSIAYFFPNLDISKIKVFISPLKDYNFANESIKNLESFGLTAGKYILLLTGNKYHKGAYRACIVLNDLINKNRIPSDIKIVVLGVSYKKHYEKLTKKSSRFIFTKYVSAPDLEVLYKNAHLYLCPSLNEGFGYPPMEAMKYGTLCACSANSALTEVYGDSVLYFNPFDLNEMGNRILQSFDKDIQNEFKQRLPKRFEHIKNKQIQDLDLLIKEILQENL